MLILSKKKILTILLGVFVFLFAISFIITDNDLENREEIIETVSTPVSNKVVIVDAGHGTPDEGVSLLHQVKNRSNYSFIKNNCRCKSLQFF